MVSGERHIKLLYFAALRERLGSDGEVITLPEGVTRVAELLAFLPTIRPALRGVLGAVRVAVGEELAGPDARIAAGDEVALLPPVSGG